MNKILLIGGTGFLGAKIKDHYENNSIEVITMGRNELSDIVTDFSDIDFVELVNWQFDTIVHCLAVNETKINESIDETYKINVTLTRKILEIAVKCGVKNFIYLSTFHVYGKTTGYIDEKSDNKPLNDYGLTHYLSENIVQNICSLNSINYLLVRPTNIYGVPSVNTPFSRWSLVPFQFVKMAKETNAIKLQSSGEQLRNFVSVDDVIHCFELLGKKHIVNAYGCETLSIYDFANLVASKYLDITGQVVPVERPPWAPVEKGSLLTITNTFDDYVPSEGHLEQYLISMIAGGKCCV